MRPLCIHHCTSEPVRFCGRAAELALLDRAFAGGAPSVVAMVGPGGQGKTAIAQTWLRQFREGKTSADGVFFWSFYRGKDSDLCLQEMYRYAERLDHLPEVSSSYCVDRLLAVLRAERWAVVLDGTEVVQHEGGAWHGRFIHPELGRLLEELASEPLPGVVIVTSRFPLPTLEHRRHAEALALSALAPESAVALLRGLGVRGEEAVLRAAAAACGHHAKAVELLGTFLAAFHGGDARKFNELPPVASEPGMSAEEASVACVLDAFRQTLPREDQDIVSLATAFRQPPAEAQLVQYLSSGPVRQMLHDHWQRAYVPFAERPEGWLAERLEKLVALRLLERVHSGRSDAGGVLVIDAHPLVRRGFEEVRGAGAQEHARARAGFLRGRPDRRPPASLEDAREEVELFHAYCDAGMWDEADSVFVALDNPKHRFLAPAFERDLLLRFFPGGDWRLPPLWPGFGRYRSLAISFELLGQFADALEAYRPADAPLRGDALLALGQLGPLLTTAQVAQPWQTLWQAYRAHALCLAGRTAEGLAAARTLVPVDVYEWVHVFETLLRAGRLDALDLRSVLYRPPFAQEHRWGELARRRMRLDYARRKEPYADWNREYLELLEDYDRGGLPFERALTRLGYARWLLARGEAEPARSVLGAALAVARRHRMPILAADALHMLQEIEPRADRDREIDELRASAGYRAAARP